MGKSKYGAVATVIDGHRFPSKREAKRYGELKLLERAGEIRDLRLQPRFPLCVPGSDLTPIEIGVYIADFAYEQRTVRGIKPRFPGRTKSASLSVEWNDVIEDSKGFRTPVYRLKKRMVEAQYDIQITEV
jgi:hypothetical protein